MCFSYSFSFPSANPFLAAGFGVESDENDLESPVNEEDMEKKEARLGRSADDAPSASKTSSVATAPRAAWGTITRKRKIAKTLLSLSFKKTLTFESGAVEKNDKE